MKKELILKVGGREVTIESRDSIPVAISKQLEDVEHYEQKRGALAFDVVVPATLDNDKAFNQFHNLNVEDLTPGQQFRNPQPAILICDGEELITGKAILNDATHTDRPEKYSVNVFGDNSDWVIDLAETTLWDCLSQHIHTFTPNNVKASWDFDGTSEQLDYVYAPVRYRETWGEEDDLVLPIHLRPSLSIYWMLWRAFNAIGYRISSSFFDTDYFRRMVMPWTWGNFLFLNTKGMDVLRFKAKSTAVQVTTGTPPVSTTFYGYWNYFPSASAATSGSVEPHAVPGYAWKMDNDSTCGGFNDAGVYSWDQATGEARWFYDPIYHNQWGDLIVNFRYKAAFRLSVGANCTAGIEVDFVHRRGANIIAQQTVLIHSLNGPGFNPIGTNSATFDGVKEVDWQSPISLEGGDVIGAKLRITYSKSFIGHVSIRVYGEQCSSNSEKECEFYINYFKKPLGGNVNFRDYEKFKEYKLLDLLRGVADCFDLSFDTDSKNKVVTIEPTHAYHLADDPFDQRQGFYRPERQNWNDKIDLSQENRLELYRDSEREHEFLFREDPNDGGLNKYIGRHEATPGAARYVFPERFKQGKKEMVNRFFSPVVHCRIFQFKNVGNSGVAPQMIAIIPENISNTSRNESEYFFQPKLAWYKGKVDRNLYGGWRFGRYNAFGVPVYDAGTGKQLVDPDQLDMPFMFAVNYVHNGKVDPVLTYCDQRVASDTPGTSDELAIGLMRRFYLSRLAIRRYGKLYRPYIFLDSRDVRMHRERIFIQDGIYELIEIDGYRPLVEGSTRCVLWKVAPAGGGDESACFPSQSAVIDNVQTGGQDIKYAQLLLLTTDFKPEE